MQKVVAYGISAFIVGFGVWIIVAGLNSGVAVAGICFGLIPIAIGLLSACSDV